MGRRRAECGRVEEVSRQVGSHQTVHRAQWEARTYVPVARLLCNIHILIGLYTARIPSCAEWTSR